MGNLFKLCFLLFALSASVFVSCTPENNGDGSLETVPLPSPSVTVQEQDETSFTLVWSPGGVLSRVPPTIVTGATGQKAVRLRRIQCCHLWILFRIRHM